MSSRRDLRAPLALAAALGLLASGCSAIMGGAAVAVVVGASALAYDCDEPVTVGVWDGATGRPVCDAEVTAEALGKVIAFSPCYAVYLGEGSWTVTARRADREPATGTITIPHDHSCGRPVVHSLELTLRRTGPPAAAAPPSPAPAPPPSPAPAPPEPPMAPPATAPALAPPATATEPALPPPAPSEAAPPVPAPPTGTDPTAAPSVEPASRHAP